jgi:hypothetical protein
MFVFGEVQDPHSDTVNLVEDIVRSQIIELARNVIVRHSAVPHNLRRSYKLVHWLFVVAPDI